MTVCSCCIDRGFGKEKSLDAKQAHLTGLDLNLVAAYGYLLIAAISLVANMRLYLSDDFSEDRIGLFAAQLIVVGWEPQLGWRSLCYAFTAGRVGDLTRGRSFSARHVPSCSFRLQNHWT